MDLQNLPALCGHHIRRLGEIYRSYLPESEKVIAFEADLHETSDCRSCLARRRGEYLPRRMKVKVCLVGEAATDKTELIRRFVLDNFDDEYVQTIGTHVSKKELRVASPDGSGELTVDMTIWDIMGQKAYRELLKEAYFYGARGILAVCDITREKTLDDLDDWIDGVYSVTGKIPIILLGNKTEFYEQAQVHREDLARVAKQYNCPYFFTSARTGLNVELAFRTLAERVAKERYTRRVVPEE